MAKRKDAGRKKLQRSGEGCIRHTSRLCVPYVHVVVYNAGAAVLRALSLSLSIRKLSLSPSTLYYHAGIARIHAQARRPARGWALIVLVHVPPLRLHSTYCPSFAMRGSAPPHHPARNSPPPTTTTGRESLQSPALLPQQVALPKTRFPLLASYTIDRFSASE